MSSVTPSPTAPRSSGEIRRTAPWRTSSSWSTTESTGAAGSMAGAAVAVDRAGHDRGMRRSSWCCRSPRPTGPRWLGWTCSAGSSEATVTSGGVVTAALEVAGRSSDVAGRHVGLDSGLGTPHVRGRGEDAERDDHPGDQRRCRAQERGSTQSRCRVPPHGGSPRRQTFPRDIGRPGVLLECHRENTLRDVGSVKVTCATLVGCSPAPRVRRGDGDGPRGRRRHPRRAGRRRPGPGDRPGCRSQRAWMRSSADPPAHPGLLHERGRVTGGW